MSDFEDVRDVAKKAIDLNIEQQKKIVQLQAEVEAQTSQIRKLKRDVHDGDGCISRRDFVINQLQAEIERLKSTVSYKQIGFVHLKRWQAGNSPEHCFSTEKEQYGDVAVYVEEQNHD